MKRIIPVPEYLRQFFGENPPEQVEVRIIDDEFAAGEAVEVNDGVCPASGPTSPATAGRTKPHGLLPLRM